MAKETKKAFAKITVDDYSCTVSKPTRQVLEVVLGMLGVNGQKPQMLKAGEIILNSCWIDGDKEILQDDDLLVAASLQAYQLIEIKQASLEKL